MRPTGLRAIVAAVVVAACGGVARADGFGALEQDKKPQFGAYDVAISPEGVPDGWKLQPSTTSNDDTKAIDAEASALAGATGAKVTPIDRVATSPDGKTVALVLLDVDEAGPAFAKAMQDSGGKKGWTVVALGTPWRLLVAAGAEPARKAAVDAQVRYAAKMLGITAMSAVEAHRATRAVEFAKGAVAIDPKSAPGHYVLALRAADGVRNEEKGVEMADVVAHLRAALDKDAHDALTGEDLFNARVNAADAILRQKDAESDKLARDYYKEAFASLKDLKDVDRRVIFGGRYNLACAHSRLKEIDEAFVQLTTVLEEDAKEPIPGIEHWRDGDPDLDNMKSDPRWKTLLEKYPKSAKADDGGN